MAELSVAIGAEWLTRPEALRALEKSQSTLERLVAAGDIQTKQQEVEGRKPMTLYQRGDVERIAAAPRRAVARIPNNVTPELVRALVERTAAPAAVPITEKLWLSLDEAVEYSGLARSDLAKLCQISLREQAAWRAERLPGTLVVRKSGGWKILRRSLEEFEG